MNRRPELTDDEIKARIVADDDVKAATGVVLILVGITAVAGLIAWAITSADQRQLAAKVAWLHDQGCVLRSVDNTAILGPVGTFDCRGVVRIYDGKLVTAWEAAP